MKAKDLQLADVVQRTKNNLVFGTLTVSQIENDFVTFFRPYTHTADFSSSGGVICYVGFEEFKVHVQDGIEYDLLERKQLK